MIENKLKNHKIMIIILSIILFLVLFYKPIDVESASEQQDINVLVIYSSESGEVDEYQRILDLLLGHFTSFITFKHSSEITEGDFSGITHLVYYGQVEEELPPAVVEMMNSYRGPVLGIGYNVSQFKRHFSFIQSADLEIWEDIQIKKGNNRVFKMDSHPIMNISSITGSKVLIEVERDGALYPLFLKNDQTYYFATTNLFPPLSNILAEELHNFFNRNHPTKTTAILRLEDIHPRLEPTNLMKIAEFLKEKDIPYMASVTPVYVNPQTEEEYHLSETPKLVEALRYMQENGASIVLHGYTDQYNLSQTGDGFEFWDQEKNRPIGQEVDYIINRITRGTQELVDYGIYPIAFEAPHYAMSQAGYKEVSTTFSTYVGQVQLTDQDWKIMTESPYITTPKFLHGMKLVPETIRYIRYEDPGSILEMKERVEEFTIVRDGIIGGFYHPFLGVEGLTELVKEMEEIPHLQWLNLKDMENKVETNSVTIQTKNGEVVVFNEQDQNTTPSSRGGLVYFLNQISEKELLWTSIGASITLMVALCSFFLFRKKEKI